MAVKIAALLLGVTTVVASLASVGNVASNTNQRAQSASIPPTTLKTAATALKTAILGYAQSQVTFYISKKNANLRVSMSCPPNRSIPLHFLLVKLSYLAGKVSVETDGCEQFFTGVTLGIKGDAFANPQDFQEVHAFARVLNLRVPIQPSSTGRSTEKDAVVSGSSDFIDTQRATQEDRANMPPSSCTLLAKDKDMLFEIAEAHVQKVFEGIANDIVTNQACS